MSSTPGRSRVIRHEHELGEWVRARRAPDPRLRGLLGRELLGYEHSAVRFDAWLEPPRPELTLMLGLDEGGGLSADGVGLPDAWLGGLDDRPTIVGVGESYGAIDLKLSPLGAWTLLGGRPLSEVTGACVALDEVFGPAGALLAERLRAASGWDARFDLVEAFLLARLAEGPAVTPAVAWAWRRLCSSDGAVPVGSLAAEIGCSRRYLSERFRAEIGLPPKTVARVLRFHAVRQRISAAPARWAAVAAEAGYADHSHLDREFREFARITPSEFAARLIPGGGVLGGSVDRGSHSSKTRAAAAGTVGP